MKAVQCRIQLGRFKTAFEDNLDGLGKVIEAGPSNPTAVKCRGAVVNAQSRTGSGFL